MSQPAVHANCVILGTCGVLIRGDAGSGKSSLSDVLVEAARRKGNLGRLVADDYVHLSAAGGRLLASVPESIRDRMEVRGFGLVDTSCVPVARIGLVVDLVPPETLERLPEAPFLEACLEAVQLPLIRCPKNDTGGSLRLIRWGLRRLAPGGPDYI